MNWNSFRYLMKEGLKSIWKHKMMSFASIGVLTACLTLIGASVLVSLNIEKLVDSVQDQNQIVAFVDTFQKDEEAEKTQSLKQAVKSMDNIKEMTFVSREEAYEEQKKQLGKDAALLEGFDGDNNPYPAKFILTVKEQEKLPATVKALEKLEGINKVNSAVDVSKMLVNVRNMVQLFGTVTFVALVLVSLVIISNTIRLTVFSRRKEINIMKMVGATNGFIRTPFLVEGMLLGLLGALLAFLLLWGCYDVVVQQFDLSHMLNMNSYDGVIPFKSLATSLVLSFCAAGVLTGLVGSTAAVRKHLQV